MNALSIAKEIAKAFEGWSGKVYLCPAGYWTIGYGRKVAKDHPPISRQQGETYLDADMMRALKGALKYCPVLAKDDRKLAAIADFCFNLGVGRLQTSTLKQRINDQDWDEAAYELSRWIYAKGKKLLGLIKRRAAEIKLMEVD